jgi:hypothetical protein
MKRPREEVRLSGLAGATEQNVWMSRTGEKARRGEEKGTKTRTHCRERKAGIQVDETE